MVNSFDESGDFGEPFYEVRIDSQEVPFTSMRSVTSSGQNYFLTCGRTCMLSLSLKNYNFLPIRNKCNPDESYDYKKCLETALTENLTKEAPCVKPSAFPSQHAEPGMQRQCNTSEDEKDLLNYYHNVVQENFDPGCLRKCNRTTYNVLQLDYPHLPCDPQIAVMKMNIPIPDVEVIDELELTSLPQYSADMGGILGLYLGTSFLGVQKNLEKAAGWFKSRVFKTGIGFLQQRILPLMCSLIKLKNG
ncbi:unnamed protein product [Darwinula stevensoni]|uniref:Uncharacterized protein n=1 Tax=Darwinula stevensoni TaxID=69355 RepID=A0A7R9AE52_9CRUS|nr:unnamed protein product [Darwinula stevensoni]CAG0901576.1 unnamed protein product [Darwinula stevensoni]